MADSRNRPQGGPGLGGLPVGRHNIPAPPGRSGPPVRGATVDLPTGREPAPKGKAVPVESDQLLRAYEGSDEGPYVGRSAVGDKEAPYSQSKRAFLGHFPGLDVKQWRRTSSVLASDIGIGGVVFPFGPVEVVIDTVARAQARIITGVRLEWIQRNYNPYGTVMPAGAPGYHDEFDNADGCVEFVLLANGSPLVDVREQVYTYGAGGLGPATSRTVNGWYKLHCNLLADAGQHPEALYVMESSSIVGSWRAIGQPNFRPDWLSVTLDGWTCSFETLRRVQQAAGLSF